MAFRFVLRAKIILALEHDRCVTAVASLLRVHVRTVRKWRDRFLERRVAGLHDLPRMGRPVRISSVTRCEVVAMACGRPRDFGVTSRTLWTLDALHETFVRQHAGVQISRTSVIRILQGADVKPHRLRAWLHSPDPRFREKVTAICDLYLCPPKDAIVLCIDEKPVQALGRRYPTKMARRGQAGREDYEYVRRGTFKVLAAFDVATGTVYAECRPTRTAEDLISFMEAIAVQTRDFEVYVIWDNLNIHYDGADQRWTAFNRRHGGRFHFVYTPLHASWVNQVEIFFSILGKRVLRHASFGSRDESMLAIDRFIEHWNHHEAHPFLWTFKGYPLQTGKAA